MPTQSVSSMNQQRFVVIGSNSFSGAYFTSHLMKKGHNVAGTSRSDELDPVFLPYKWESSPGSFEYHQIDLNKQTDELIKIIKDFKADSLN